LILPAFFRAQRPDVQRLPPNRGNRSASFCRFCGALIDSNAIGRAVWMNWKPETASLLTE
jgi:hypothetical protein